MLRQVKVPHSYYYREMYLPQATSGPSSVTWSPDGRELIYSMQGSLWRQRVGSRRGPPAHGRARLRLPARLVSGRSPCCRTRPIRGDAIELRLLDLASGDSRALVADGAVNVEPRWSPDGQRLAFVSSAYEGRWHIFIAPLVAAGGLAAERITEDRDSRLPRYYYGASRPVSLSHLVARWQGFDPGVESRATSGARAASGGWRHTSGAEPQELHYEETTWKARPDWSRDGKRVVYSSYLGRQWHQLWLMTADGGDPFQLTYRRG